MPQPKKNTRKKRVYRRRDEQERAAQAVGDAQGRRVEILQYELEIAQLEAIPVADRASNWQSRRDDAQHHLDQSLAQADALEKQAASLGGPPSAQEKRDRRRAIKTARIEALERQLDSWEDTMAGHERNLDALEALPASARDSWRGDIQGKAVPPSQDNPAGGGASWQEMFDANEQSLDLIERALEAGQALLKTEKGEAEKDS